MTDTKGTVHPWTNPHPPPTLITQQKSHAKSTLPPQFAELVSLTEKPFIQAVTDVLSPQSVFYNGKVVLVGDALAGFRPHTAGSTSQAAFHALELYEYLRRAEREGGEGDGGEVDWRGFENVVLEYAKKGVEHGIQLGTRSQFKEHRMIKSGEGLMVAMQGGPMADSS